MHHRGSAGHFASFFFPSLCVSSLALAGCSAPAESGIAEDADDTNVSSNSQFLVGADDRTLVDSFKHMSAVSLYIVRRDPLTNQTNSTNCSGTMIASNIVLTAAHCLVGRNLESPQNTEEVRVVPGRQGGFAPVVAGRMIPNSRWVDLSKDLALFAVNRSYQAIKPLCSTAPAVGANVVSYGYPGRDEDPNAIPDIADGFRVDHFQYKAPGKVVFAAGNVIVTDEDVSGGQSGSGILRSDESCVFAVRSTTSAASVVGNTQLAAQVSSLAQAHPPTAVSNLASPWVRVGKPTLECPAMVFNDAKSRVILAQRDPATRLVYAHLYSTSGTPISENNLMGTNAFFAPSMIQLTSNTTWVYIVTEDGQIRYGGMSWGAGSTPTISTSFSSAAPAGTARSPVTIANNGGFNRIDLLARRPNNKMTWVRFDGLNFTVDNSSLSNFFSGEKNFVEPMAAAARGTTLLAAVFEDGQADTSFSSNGNAGSWSNILERIAPLPGEVYAAPPVVVMPNSTDALLFVRTRMGGMRVAQCVGGGGVPCNMAGFGWGGGVGFVVPPVQSGDIQLDEPFGLNFKVVRISDTKLEVYYVENWSVKSFPMVRIEGGGILGWFVSDTPKNHGTGALDICEAIATPTARYILARGLDGKPYFLRLGFVASG